MNTTLKQLKEIAESCPRIVRIESNAKSGTLSIYFWIDSASGVKNMRRIEDPRLNWKQKRETFSRIIEKINQGTWLGLPENR